MNTIDLDRNPVTARWIGSEDDCYMGLVAEDLKDAAVDIMAVHESSMGLISREEREDIAHAAALMALTWKEIQKVRNELFPQ